jgi:Ulp1 family protease
MDRMMKSARSYFKSAPAPDHNWLLLEKVFIPVNFGNNHWAFFVVFPKKQHIVYYDSLGKRDIRDEIKTLQDFIDKESERLLPGNKKKSWMIHHEAKCTQQENGNDCGVFVSMFSQFIFHDWPVMFRQTMASNYRKYMALCFLHRKIQ